MLSNLFLRTPTHQDRKSLERLNQLCLPTIYPPSVYRQLLQHSLYCRMAFTHADQKKLVAAICAAPDTNDTSNLYIYTLACYPSYRRMGIGSHLLKTLISEAKKTQQINQVSLHVQTSNMDALRFYRRFGFEVVKQLDGYYENLSDCKNAYLLCKKLN